MLSRQIKSLRDAIPHHDFYTFLKQKVQGFPVTFAFCRSFGSLFLWLTYESQIPQSALGFLFIFPIPFGLVY